MAKIQSGEGPIGLLTEEIIEVFDQFSWLVAVGERFWREDKNLKRVTILWITNNTMLFLVMLATTYHYINNFAMLAYSAHHAILIFTDVAIPFIFYSHRQNIRYIIQKIMSMIVLFFQSILSELVEAYARNLLATRTVQMRAILKLMTFVAVSILLIVEVFFLLEIFLLKNYTTVFPMYVGLDLDDPIIYSLVISWQQVCVVFTTGIIASCMVIMYLAWNHISLETAILNYAIGNSEEIAKELSVKYEREYDSNNSYAFEDHFRNVVKHHQLIILYYGIFNTSIKGLTTLVVMDGLCLFVSSGLAVLSDNFGVKVKLLFFLATQFCVIYTWCWIGQYLNDRGDLIVKACSEAPWWLMPKTCRTALIMIVRRCMRPMNLTTSMGQPANHVSFMDMLTTCYQAINIIIQTKDKIKL